MAFTSGSFIPGSFTTGVHTTGSFGNIYDPDAQAYFDKLTTLGYTAPSAFMKTGYNNFFINLKNGINHGTNVFIKRDRIWWRGSEVIQHNLVSLSNPNSTLAEEKNAISSTWVQYQGYFPNGIDQYIDLHYDASVDGVNYTLNSASITFYSRTNSNTMPATGVRNPGTADFIQITPRGSGNFTAFINMFGSGAATATVADSLGSFITSRTSSSNVDLYKRGIFLNSNTATSTLIPSGNIYENCQNDQGTADSFDIRNKLMYDIGESLNSNEASDYDAAITAFATYLGVAV